VAREIGWYSDANITVESFDRRAEAEAVAVRISYDKFTKAPGLIDRRGVNGRLRSCVGVETPRPKGHVTLVNIINKDTTDGAEDTISCMA